MASPPFNITQAVPGDSDVASQFPAAERSFRDIVESWLTMEHGVSGHHKIMVLTTAARNAITDWEFGSLVYNTTTQTLQIQTDADSSPITWVDVIDPADPSPTFLAGTSMLFFNATAPTGWTKQTTHNDKAIRLVSGTPSSGGTSPFSTVFGLITTAGFTLTSTHMPAHTHSLSGAFAFTGTTGAGGDHSHQYNDKQRSGTTTRDSSGSQSVNTGEDDDSRTTGLSGTHTHAFSGDVTLSGNTGSAGSGASHAHAIELRVQYVDAIICNKA